jgi:tripartite-type tricarboxylate transporter receptor subunit TctC
VHPSVTAKSVKELIALVKRRPREMFFGSPGNGSAPHLAGELFNTLAGVQMVHIPYRGSGPAMIGLLSGETPVMFLPAINAGPHIKSGRLRAIAVTSTARLQSMPELPTVAEAGLKGYESSQWYGVLAPAGTPEEILNTLNAHIVRIMQTTDMKNRLHEDGIVPVGGSRQQFAAYIKAELVKWADVIKRSGARID